jgi:hypothetical protein
MTTQSTTESRRASLGGVPDALMNLLDAQMRLGADLFESLTGRAAPSLRDVRSGMRSIVAMGGRAAAGCEPGRGTCAIPAPCWMPRSLGDCTSHVSPCRTACVRIVVTNCDRVRRTIAVRVAGPNAGKVTLSPPSLTLDPQERGTISACVAVPEEAKEGERTEALIWVRGCKEYYLRWSVSVGTVGLGSCHEIEVCDCPDYVHHWYDHFYCVRPCPADRDRIQTDPSRPTSAVPVNE